MTVQELADRVLDERRGAWANSDPQTAIVATQELTPDDRAAVRRVVASAGYAGDELEEMCRRVAERVVGRVEALADKLPARGGD
jgi:hypothetical protein